MGTTRRGPGGSRGEHPLTSPENPLGPSAGLPTPVRTGTPTPPRRLLRGAEQLGHLVGARLLVGITVRNADGSVRSAEQFCGRVLEVGDGVVVVDRGGQPAVLPADPPAYEVARPGRYVLAATGENVLDPDYVTVWDVLAQE